MRQSFLTTLDEYQMSDRNTWTKAKSAAYTATWANDENTMSFSSGRAFT
jgi:hypothetical protein